MNKRTEILIIILILIIFIGLIWAAMALGGERVIIRRYDKDYNRTGYSVIENGRESHFDREGNRTGHSVYDRDKIDHYDRDWNRSGHSDIEDDNSKDDKKERE